MAHDRITHLRLADGTDWETVQASVEALVERVAAVETLERLRLVRADDARGVLLLGFSDAGALERISRDIIDPWMATQLRPLLSERPTETSGEAIFTLTRAPDDEWAALEGLDARERLDYFARRVAESDGVWGLYGETWARSPRTDGAEALPFWPHMELAARCITDAWSTFCPRRIELEAFLDQWLSGMREDGIVAVVSPTPRAPGVTVSADELAAALHAAIADA